MPRGGFQGVACRHSDSHRRGRMWDPLILTPEWLRPGFPSGENHEGYCPSWNPNTQRMELRPPHLVFGPGALTSGSTSNITLVTDTWVPMYGGIPGDGYGMRGGMVGYLPRGRWAIVYGQVCIATPSVSKPFRVRVMQGTVEANPSTQPKIIGGSPIVLTGAGGLEYSPGVANIPFTISFAAGDIQYAGAREYANEVWVEVKAEDTAAAGPGAALCSTGDSIDGTVSYMNFIKKDGLYGVM